MFFPWVGLFEQIRLADVFVHYDDVQFSKGGFSNRVQLKTRDGLKWLTVPLDNLRLGQKINDVFVKPTDTWQPRHVTLLRQAYTGAMYQEEMLALLGSVYEKPVESLADLSIRSIEAVCRYFGLDVGRRFLRSSQLAIDGSSSRRVLDLVLAVGGDVYVTGHGARDYLDHELFERAGVQVRYMDYCKAPYPQLHGEFTPYVSALDLIANAGADGLRFIKSPSVHWKEFIGG
jgi:hypothetical protein